MNSDRRNRFAIVVGTAVLIGAIWVIHGYLRETVFRIEFSRRVEHAANLARSFEEHTLALLGQVASVLKATRYEFEQHGGLGAAMAFVARVPLSTPAVDHIAIDDRNGDVLFLSNRPNFPRANVADRDYFAFQKNSAGDELFIGTPAVGRASGKALFRVSLRLRDADGSFAGIVKAGVDPTAFSRFYDSFVLGPNGSVSLIGLDKILRARNGVGAQAIGQPVPGTVLWSALEAAPHGTYRQVSVVDREPRVYAYRKVSGYPLVVTIGASERDARSAAVGLQDLTTVLAFVASLVILLIAGLVWRQVTITRSLASANDAKGQFLARMSHELRTPLNAVMGFSEVIRDLRFGREAVDKYADYARDIHASGAYLLELVNDVLDLSKIEAGHYEIVDEQVDVAEVTAECVAMMSENLRRGGLVIENRLDGDLPRLRAERRAVRQVLLNLLSNAVKFTPHGGTITVCGSIDETDDLVLTVRDTGTGIPEDFLTRITEPFARETATVRQKFEGSGLGLAISNHLMRLHGGTLSIASEFGKGTTVSLRFPALRVLPAGSAAAG